MFCKSTINILVFYSINVFIIHFDNWHFGFIFYFILYFLYTYVEKKMATHSSVLAWRIPGMGEPGGLPSVGSHRVGHDWSDLGVVYTYVFYVYFFPCQLIVFSLISLFLVLEGSFLLYGYYWKYNMDSYLLKVRIKWNPNVSAPVTLCLIIYCYIHLRKHRHNQDNEHIHRPLKCPCALCNCPHSEPHSFFIYRQPLICFL